MPLGGRAWFGGVGLLLERRMRRDAAMRRPATLHAACPMLRAHRCQSRHPQAAWAVQPCREPCECRQGVVVSAGGRALVEPAAPAGRSRAGGASRAAHLVPEPSPPARPSCLPFTRFLVNTSSSAVVQQRDQGRCWRARQSGAPMRARTFTRIKEVGHGRRVGCSSRPWELHRSA
jgi:hypothetical protein